METRDLDAPMSVLALSVAAMTAAGCTAEQINAVVQAHEAEFERLSADRRAKKTAQKRKERERLSPVVAATACDMTRHEATKKVSSLPPDGFPDDSISNPSLTPNPPSKIPHFAGARGTSLPENWQPSESLFAYGAGVGLSRQQCADHLEDFRLWAHANRNRAIARKDDWNKTAMGWLRREARRPQPRAGPAKDGGLMGAIKNFLGDDCDANERRREESTGQTVLGLPFARDHG